MIIRKLEKEHMQEAQKLAYENYLEECTKTDSLPGDCQIPDMSWLIEYGYGVAAFEEDKMLGFVACFPANDSAFGTKVKGTFSPAHAHGCVVQNRDRIYREMYQSLAEELVKDGILYHSIALYEHDSEGIGSYFHNGFGHRCVDSVRRMEEIPDVKASSGISFEELSCKDVGMVRDLRRKLCAHLSESTCFMYITEEDFEDWLAHRESSETRLFVARKDDEIIAFIEVSDEGENFITAHSRMKNICGAFCMPEYRGNHIVQNLLNYIIRLLKEEGDLYLGVDYESFNPTAYHFWKKYFEPYTCSVTRRIDEGVLEKYR